MKTLKKERQKVEDKWKILTKQAAMKNPNFKEPVGNTIRLSWFSKLRVVPYTEAHIVGQHNGLNNGNIYLM